MGSSLLVLRFGFKVHTISQALTQSFEQAPPGSGFRYEPVKPFAPVFTRPQPVYDRPAHRALADALDRHAVPLARDTQVGLIFWITGDDEDNDRSWYLTHCQRILAESHSNK